MKTNILSGVELNVIISDAAAHVGCDGMCCVECIESGIEDAKCPNQDFLLLTRQLKALEEYAVKVESTLGKK